MLIRVCVVPVLLLAGCSQTRESTAHKVGIDSTGISVTVSSTQVPSLSASADTSPSAALVTGPWFDTRQVFDTSLNAPNLQCAPKVVSRRDTVSLRAEIPHGAYLVVLNPDTTFFFLVRPELGHPERSPLEPSETFRQTLITRFRADVRAKPAVYGRDTLEPIFNAPGEYIIEVGDNLESEGGVEYIWKCSVRFDPWKQ